MIPERQAVDLVGPTVGALQGLVVAQGRLRPEPGRGVFRELAPDDRVRRHGLAEGVEVLDVVVEFLRQILVDAQVVDKGLADAGLGDGGVLLVDQARGEAAPVAVGGVVSAGVLHIHGVKWNAVGAGDGLGNHIIVGPRPVVDVVHQTEVSVAVPDKPGAVVTHPPGVGLGVQVGEVARGYAVVVQPTVPVARILGDDDHIPGLLQSVHQLSVVPQAEDSQGLIPLGRRSHGARRGRRGLGGRADFVHASPFLRRNADRQVLDTGRHLTLGRTQRGPAQDEGEDGDETLGSARIPGQ